MMFSNPGLVYFAEIGPKKILDLMNVQWLTRENVASHLQVNIFLISFLLISAESMHLNL